MPDAPILLLFQQVVQNAELRIKVLVDVHLADVVEQIEVEILHAGLFQLRLKDLPHLWHVGHIVAGKLGRDEKAVPGIPSERIAHDGFGIPAVVAPGRVVVIDALRHGLVHHAEGLFLVDPVVVAVDHGQAHRAKAKRRELELLKCSGNHGHPPHFLFHSVVFIPMLINQSAMSSLDAPAGKRRLSSQVTVSETSG